MATTWFYLTGSESFSAGSPVVLVAHVNPVDLFVRKWVFYLWPPLFAGLLLFANENLVVYSIDSAYLHSGYPWPVVNSKPLGVSDSEWVSVP